jgi:hypothetical protein
MTNDSRSQHNEPRQILADSRDAIEHFPYRKRVALLHEFEETEARQSDIESSTSRSRVALSDKATTTLLNGVPQEMIVNLWQRIDSLRSNVRHLQNRIDENRRKLS